MVNALAISCLDHCNVILYGISKYKRDKLKLIQNTAVRLVMGSKNSDKVTLLLKDLHWLPVEQRIDFKILSTCITSSFKILYSQSANYLKPPINPFPSTLFSDYHST